MKLVLNSTSELATLNGARCRVWRGHTENGVEVYAFIGRIAVAATEDQEQFQRELKEQAHEALAIDLRMLL